jgi:hypothetical protein
MTKHDQLALADRLDRYALAFTRMTAWLTRADDPFEGEQMSADCRAAAQLIRFVTNAFPAREGGDAQ